MGLISNLAEEKNCKILLIHNGGDDPEINEAIDEYREKVVDLEFTFNPSIDDCLKIIWPSGCHFQIERIFRELDSKNLRVMEKTRTIFEYFEKNLLPSFPEAVDKIASDAAALAIFHFEYSKSFTMEEILGHSYLLALVDRDKEKQKKFLPLSQIEFYSNGLTELVADYLRDGFVNFDARAELIQKQKDECLNSEIQSETSIAWRRCHTSFAFSQMEAIDGFYELLDKRGLTLSLRTIYEICDFIKELDASKVPTELLENAIESYSKKYSISSRSELEFHDFPAELRERIVARLKESNSVPTFTELIDSLTQPDSFNPSDIELLAKIPAVDIKTWIFTDKNDPIRKIRKLRNRFSEDQRAAIIFGVIDEALAELGARSPLDQKRVEWASRERDLIFH